MRAKCNYSVYMHINKLNQKVYIGITSKDPLVRWGNGSTYNHSRHFDSAIKKYGWDSFEHIVILSGLTQEQACSWEIALIAMYDSTNPDKGYNISFGGSAGFKGLHHSEKSRRILSRIGHTKTGELNSFYGYKHTEEAKKKMSIAKHKNPNTRKNALIGGMKTREKIMKPVLQYAVDGEFIKRYDCATDASLSIAGKKDSHICDVCRGDRKTAYGYVWKYEEVT